MRLRLVPRVAMNFSKLRSHRKRSGLTQKEVAFLLGGKKHSTISRYEAGERRPDLRTALAYCWLFDRELDELFPGVREEAHREVEERAKHLTREISQQRYGTKNSYKLKKLARMQKEGTRDASAV